MTAEPEVTPLDPVALANANAKAKGKRPSYLEDPAVERVLSITMAVAGELAVMRERLDTVERLLETKGVVKREDIERYEPDANAAAMRGQWHREYISRILRLLQQDIEGLAAAASEQTCDELAEEFGGDAPEGPK